MRSQARPAPAGEWAPRWGRRFPAARASSGRAARTRRGRSAVDQAAKGCRSLPGRACRQSAAAKGIAHARCRISGRGQGTRSKASRRRLSPGTSTPSRTASVPSRQALVSSRKMSTSVPVSMASTLAISGRPLSSSGVRMRSDPTQARIAVNSPIPPPPEALNRLRRRRPAPRAGSKHVTDDQHFSLVGVVVGVATGRERRRCAGGARRCVLRRRPRRLRRRRPGLSGCRGDDEALYLLRHQLGERLHRVDEVR